MRAQCKRWSILHQMYGCRFPSMKSTSPALYFLSSSIPMVEMGACIVGQRAVLQKDNLHINCHLGGSRLSSRTKLNAPISQMNHQACPNEKVASMLEVVIATASKTEDIGFCGDLCSLVREVWQCQCFGVCFAPLETLPQLKLSFVALSRTAAIRAISTPC